MSFETVWQSLNSQPIYHFRRVTFSEEIRPSHMQQSSRPQSVYILRGTETATTA